MSQILNPKSRLGMISQFQLHRMRVKVDLLLQVGLVVFAHIVADQSKGHDKWDIALSVLIECLQQFLLFISGELFFEIAHHVLEHVDIFLDGGFYLQGLHKQSLVLRVQLLGGDAFGRRYQFSQDARMLLAM